MVSCTLEATKQGNQKFMQTLSAAPKQAGQLPALSQHKTLRYFNFIALYIAQGIPEGMLFFAIPAWMAANGKTPGEIGSFVAVCGLPWSFKIVVAPLMDRFSYLPTTLIIRTH